MESAPLPIDDFLPEICRSVREAGVLALVAEPGAGKTTRVPPALVDSGVLGSGRLIVLQPRRVAARQAARRISAERGQAVGAFAGYRVRFESRTGRETRIEVVTEGILTRMLQSDPGLARAAGVVLDEFHERSLHADLALALLAQVRASLRPDLKLVVMSATLESEAVAEFLGAPVLRVPGRVHPLEIEYSGSDAREPTEKRVARGVRRALAREGGDVLVFLPGVGEIRRASRELEPVARERDLELLELYGDQRPEVQDRVFTPGARRRVLLATNVAETSITVPGVDCVVDSGLARSASHDAGRGVDRLELKRISKASAAQRAGRAGRLGPGRVVRLWTEAEETGMREHELPEVRRVDLTGCVLELHVWGERDLSAFAWFEAPDRAAVVRAEELLVRLGALTPGDLAPTELGRALAGIPAHPRLARILFACFEIGALEQGALFCALLSERDVLRRSPHGRESRLPTGPSDLLARRDLIDGRASSLELDRGAARAVERTRAQLERIAARAFGDAPSAPAPVSDDQLLHAVFTGFPDRLAVRSRAGGSEGRMVGGTGVVLAPESAVREEPLFCVLECELGRRGERSRARVRQASAVRPEWLEAVPGEALHLEEDTRLEGQRVVRVRRKLYEDLLLEEVELGRPDEAPATRLLLEAARREGGRALGRTPAALSLLARVRSLAAWMSELDLPPLEDADLIDLIEPWCAGKTRLAELRSIPLVDVVRSHLSREQLRALETHAPETLTMPSGTRRRLAYDPPNPPVLAVRLQELFGLRTTPTVAAGRVPVLLHLLGPNMRVVQITQDLESFWNNTYPEVRKDLRGRYPKHSWPEDPWSAKPTARTKRRRPG